MHYAIIFRVLGILLMLFSMTLLPPVIIAIVSKDGALDALVISFLIIFGAGFAIWLPVFQSRDELRTRDGFLITALFWVVLGTAGALPFIMAESHLSLVDAVFESVSGLTTTGATVITGLDQLPRSLLFYRQQLQWLGV